MAQKNASFKKKEHFLQLISGIAQEKILFCPIDVSKHFHVAIFHDIKGKALCDFFDFSSSKIGFDFFIAKLEALLSSLSPQIVFIGCEPTSIYYEGLMQNLHLRFKESLAPKFQLCILDPLAVKNNRHQHSLHFTKSDSIDCAAIGDLLCRGLYSQAFFISAESLQIKELSHSIHDYRKQLLRHWNRTLITIDRVFPNLLIDYKDEAPICKCPLESSLLQDLLHISPDPVELLELSVSDLIDLFHSQERRLGPKNAQKILSSAQRALLLAPNYRAVHLKTLSHQLDTLDFLKAQIESLTAEICQLMACTSARHLVKIAGNSEKLTADFLAALSDANRFHSVEQVWKAAGLAPSLIQSGQARQQPHISKTGSFYLRRAI